MAVLCLNPQGASQPAAQHGTAALPAMPMVPSHHLPPARSPPLSREAGGWMEGSTALQQHFPQLLRENLPLL